MDVTEKTPEQIAREIAEQIARTINTLEQGILRAREITGTRLRRTTETPALSGPTRARLGDLLDTLHKLPQHLWELIRETDPLPPSRSVERAFTAFPYIMRATERDVG
jgi:hypothetical protein